MVTLLLLFLLLFLPTHHAAPLFSAPHCFQAEDPMGLPLCNTETNLGCMTGYVCQQGKVAMGIGEVCCPLSAFKIRPSGPHPAPPQSRIPFNPRTVPQLPSRPASGGYRPKPGDLRGPSDPNFPLPPPPGPVDEARIGQTSDCPRRQYLCRDASWVQFMREHCPRTCNPQILQQPPILL